MVRATADDMLAMQLAREFLTRLEELITQILAEGTSARPEDGFA